jgi:hypothetical protein
MLVRVTNSVRALIKISMTSALLLISTLNIALATRRRLR